MLLRPQQQQQQQHHYYEAQLVDVSDDGGFAPLASVNESAMMPQAQYASMPPLLGGPMGEIGQVGGPSNMLLGPQQQQQQHHYYEAQFVDVSDDGGFAPLASVNESAMMPQAQYASMTQSQLKTYMMNYLKNQGTWKLSQLKNLSFEEVKKEFDKLVKQVESCAPINFEATKASLKRFDLDKDDSEDSDEVGEQEESVTGTKTPINPVPVAMKSPSIVTYKIIKQGEKGVYQIVRENGTDVVYINFGAMLKDISRDDLTELYRIVMNRYGMDGPEDELEKVFWKYLKNMFEEPLSTDPIWSALDKKLQGGKPDEDCYKMLKMMEKQVGIRN
ncbi:hypothetical protein Tco_1452627 [Tanacetum coccineum]